MHKGKLKPNSSMKKEQPPMASLLCSGFIGCNVSRSMQGKLEVVIMIVFVVTV